MHSKQVDILISKTRHCKYYTLNIVYIIMKPHKLPWIRNLRNPRKSILEKHSIQC